MNEYCLNPSETVTLALTINKSAFFIYVTYDSVLTVIISLNSVKSIFVIEKCYAFLTCQ